MTLGERIKKIRKEKDLTQQALADQIGIKQNSVALIESGKRNASDQVILAICRECHVREEWLRSGLGEMFVPSPTSELDALAARYPQMTHETYVFIEKLAALPESAQNTIMGFLREVVAGFGDVQHGASAIPGGPVDGSVAEAEAAYEKSLGLAPNTGSSVSNTTEGTDRQGGEKTG